MLLVGQLYNVSDYTRTIFTGGFVVLGVGVVSGHHDGVRSIPHT